MGGVGAHATKARIAYPGIGGILIKHGISGIDKYQSMMHYRGIARNKFKAFDELILEGIGWNNKVPIHIGAAPVGNGIGGHGKHDIGRGGELSTAVVDRHRWRQGGIAFGHAGYHPTLQGIDFGLR